MWTNVPKPTGRPYTNVNPDGKTQYDQSNVTYDDPNVFYDGVNLFAWTEVAKPLSGTSSIFAGFGTGMVIPLTTPSVFTINNDPWVYIPKPN